MFIKHVHASEIFVIQTSLDFYHPPLVRVCPLLITDECMRVCDNSVAVSLSWLNATASSTSLCCCCLHKTTLSAASSLCTHTEFNDTAAEIESILPETEALGYFFMVTPLLCGTTNVYTICTVSQFLDSNLKLIVGTLQWYSFTASFVRLKWHHHGLRLFWQIKPKLRVTVRRR